MKKKATEKDEKVCSNLIEEILVDEKVWRLEIDMMTVKILDSFLLYSHHSNFKTFVYNIPCKQIVRTFHGHYEQIRAFLILSNEESFSHFLTCSFDGSIRVWNVFEGTCKGKIENVYCNSRSVIRLNERNILFSHVDGLVSYIAIADWRSCQITYKISNPNPQGFWLEMLKGEDGKELEMISYNRRVVYRYRFKNSDRDEMVFLNSFRVRNQTRIGVEIFIKGKSYLAIAMSDLGVDIYNYVSGDLMINLEFDSESEVHFLWNFSFGILGSISDSNMMKMFLFDGDRSGENLRFETVKKITNPRPSIIVNHIHQRKTDFKYAFASNHPPSVMIFDSPLLPNEMSKENRRDDLRDFDEKMEFLISWLPNTVCLSILEGKKKLMDIPKVVFFASDFREELWMVNEKRVNLPSYLLSMVETEIVLRIMFGNGEGQILELKKYFLESNDLSLYAYYRFFGELGCFWIQCVIVGLLEVFESIRVFHFFRVSVMDQIRNQEDDDEEEEGENSINDDDDIQNIISKILNEEIRVELSPFTQQCVNILCRRKNMMAEKKTPSKKDDEKKEIFEDSMFKNLTKMKMRRLEKVDTKFMIQLHTFHDAYCHALSIFPLSSFTLSDDGISGGDVKKLRETPPLFSNVVLEVGDQKFNCNVETLIASTNFFFRMIRFDGVERYEMLTRNLIRISVISIEEMVVFLNFIYSKKLDISVNPISSHEETVELLIRILVLAEKYLEYGLIKEVLLKIHKISLKIYESKRIKKGFVERVSKLAESLPNRRKEDIIDFFRIVEKAVNAI